MPRYRFIVHAHRTVDDLYGTLLQDEGEAIVEAVDVVRELKREFGDEASDWVIEVMEGERQLERIEFKMVQ